MEPRFFKRGNKAVNQHMSMDNFSFNGTTLFQTWKYETF